MVIERKRKADKPVTDFLSTLPEKSIFGVDFKEREIEGTNEIGDKRVRVPVVDDPERHNESGTFLRSFSQENAEVFAEHGFMGIVNKKTKLTVGEKGKKEFVNIFDIKKQAKGLF